MRSTTLVSPSLLPALTLLSVLLLAEAPIAQCRVTLRESLTPGGQQADDESVLPTVSADGRYVAFNSTATNLVPGVGDGTTVLQYRRDRSTGAIDLISASSAGVPGNQSSFMLPDLSADGRLVVFHTEASNLVAGDGNQALDVFLRDMASGTTELVSRSTGGGVGNGNSWMPVITPDGRYVAFFSGASNLVPGDTNSRDDCFVYDRQTGTMELVSLSSAGALGNHDSQEPSISDDGRFVAFHSRASNLAANDTNNKFDIFVRDRQTGVTERVSVSSNGTQATGPSYSGRVTPDGRYVAFYSHAENLVPNDSNGVLDIFRHDRATGETLLVSKSSLGAQGNGDSIAPLISDDGRFVAFTSYSTTLVTNDTTPGNDVFTHDVLTGETLRVNQSSTGQEDDTGGIPGTICGGFTPDGRLFAFSSWGTNLVPGDTNGTQDVFTHELWPEPVRYCASTPNSTGDAARVSSSGNPSATAPTLVLRAAPVPDQPGLFVFGGTPAQSPFGNGFLCIGGTLHRLPVRVAVGGVLSHQLDPTLPPANIIASGSTWYFQAWFRDPAGGGALFDLTDGLAITFCP